MDGDLVFEPPKDKVLKFRVHIQQPAPWKIKSIAQYRQNKFAANAAAAAKQQEGTQKQAKTQIPQPPPVPEATQSKDTKKKRTSSFSGQLPHEGSSQRASFRSTGSKPELTEQQRTAAIEQAVKELEVYNYNSKIIQSRIAALHSVKMSLLWLLKKASMHERTMLHEGKYASQYS